MAPTPAPEGSPAAYFAALLRHHMDVGTRPTAESGIGKWTEDGLRFKANRISRRTLQYYRNGSLQPPDVTPFIKAFFGENPRHAFKRKVFLNAYADATGTEPPSSAFAEANISVHVPTHFMGRNDALSAIDAALAVDRRRVVITALHGLRGVGKTTVAAAYAYRRQRQYHATWWVRAHTVPTMRSDLINLGVRLQWIGAEDKEEPALAAVINRLRLEGEGVLLIFDNALSAESLTPYLPRDGLAQVLITSNAHNWRLLTSADPIEVRVWPSNVGADFLIARTGRSTEREAAEALSNSLGGLPLAHEQAAAYCERLDVDFAEYRRRFVAAPVKMLDNKRYAPAHYYDGQTVAKTFGLAIEAASKEHPAVQTLMWHLALLAPESVPLFLLKEKQKSLARLIHEGGGSEVASVA
jgi:hypothetical protein